VVATLFIREIAFFVMERNPNEGVADFFSSYCFSFVKGHFGVWPVISFTFLVAFVCVLCVLYHVMFRQIVRAFILREQKRSELQYELDFLKNQLSPHFLFNTLNNISALIQIDAKRAESSMNKLSQLLRMMLYQVKDKYITLREDVDILQKYADLEKLRLDESFDFVFDVKLENPNVKIEPLLMMPLMENAMKHCVNPNGKSFAHVSITQSGNEVHFHSENSNFPRKSSRKSGGLGLSTFEKRLDLMYLDAHEYSVNIVDDIYISDLVLHLKKENS
jgi:LytS/YehU family sensor histidine kinase